MKQDTNKALNASNEQAVLALVQDHKVKTQWQVRKQFYGIKEANRTVAYDYDLPMDVVKAAAYYW